MNHLPRTLHEDGDKDGTAEWWQLCVEQIVAACGNFWNSATFYMSIVKCTMIMMMMMMMMIVIYVQRPPEGYRDVLS